MTYCCWGILLHFPTGVRFKLGRQAQHDSCRYVCVRPERSCALDRLLTSAFLLAHLMAQDLIRQAPAMLICMQSSPNLLGEAAHRHADGPPNRHPPWPGSMAGTSLASSNPEP